MYVFFVKKFRTNFKKMKYLNSKNRFYNIIYLEKVSHILCNTSFVNTL